MPGAVVTDVASRGYNAPMKTVNIRALKDKLSAYLREVRHGEVYLVTDRGTVVAELRPPRADHVAEDSVDAALDRMAERGELRRGLPNRPDLYRATGVRVDPAAIRAALDAERADR